MPPSFTYHHIDPASHQHPLFPSIEKLGSSLQKWDLQQHFQLLKFRFDEAFPDSNHAEHFVHSLLRSAAFRSAFQSASRNGSMGVFVPPEDNESLPRVVPLCCTVVDLSFFDRLYEHGLVNRDTQSLAKCFDQYIASDGVTLSDRLRVLLGWAMAAVDRREDLVECDYDDQALFSETERQEFIFHLMARLAIGGPMSQYEDYFGPYLDATKLIYKDLVAVTKDATTGEPQVASKVFLLLDEGRLTLFPRDSCFNFAYVIVDPLRRHVNVLYNAMIPAI